MNDEICQNSDEELLSLIVKCNKAHKCGLKYQIVGILLREALSKSMSCDLFRKIRTIVGKYGRPEERKSVLDETDEGLKYD